MYRERSMRRVTAPIVAVTILLLPSLGFAWLDPADPGVVTVLNSQDNQFCWYGGPDNQAEWLLNYGLSSGARVKGYQDLTGLKFDLAAYRGQVVQEAELHVAKRDAAEVTSLVAATINADWQEGTKSGATATAGDPCWRWRSTPADPATATLDNEWTFRYSDFSTASFGSYGSLVCFGFKAENTFKTYTVGSQVWYAMRLDPAVVHALILDHYGLIITDARWHTTVGGNPRIYTKDQNASVQPRLYIKFVATPDTTPPGSVGGLTAEAGVEDGQVVLRFAAPTDPQAAKGFGYTVRYSTGGAFATATDVARWRIPRPKSPGTPQRMLIEDLTPGGTYTFFVQAYDGAGNGGPVTSVVFALPAARQMPVLASANLPLPDPTGKTVRGVTNVLRYWAVSELIKVSPTTGNRIGMSAGANPDDYKKANIVWDAASNTIALTACRNEVVGAQLIIERLGSNLTNVRVVASDLTALDGTKIAADPYIELFRLHYVNNTNPDPAVPLFGPFTSTFNIPGTGNANGTNQAVWVDLYVPKTASVMTHNGTLTITANELAAPVRVNLRVKVSPIEIPDYPTFLVDLNGYGNPWDAYGNPNLACLRYFQVAHKHRAMCNTLTYGWSANVRSDRGPTLTGAGANLRADNWTTFDNKYGRFFDGSAFRADTPSSPYHGPGMNTPITHLYTTFFESWPIHMLDPAYGFDAAGLGGEYWYNLKLSNLFSFFNTMPDVWGGFPSGYAQGVRNVVKDWFEHAQQKGWHRTHFQIYLNHKYSYSGCAAFWVLEENEAADDFRAVGYFHQLYRDGQALANAPDVKWHFRIDISTRWGQHYGELDNRINYHMMNSGAAGWHWPNIKYRRYTLAEDKQEEWNWYGLGQAISGGGTGYAPSFIQKWCQDLTGGLPHWDNYQDGWSSQNDLCTMYRGDQVPGAAPYDGPVMSIRVKEMRQAQQIIELLNLLAARSGWDRVAVRNAINARYGAHTWDYSFGGLNEDKIYQLRADLIAQVESFIVVPGDANGDKKVDIMDIILVVNAFGTSPGDPGYDPRADLDGNGIVDVGDLITVINNFGAGL